MVLVEPGTPHQKTDKETLTWGLALSCEMIRNRMLRLSRHIPFVYGIMVTGDDMMDNLKYDWDTFNVSVIGNVDHLETLDLPVNSDDQLPIAFPLSFIFQAEYTGQDIECANDHLLELRW